MNNQRKAGHPPPGVPLTSKEGERVNAVRKMKTVWRNGILVKGNKP